jgi:hypothetical protein
MDVGRFVGLLCGVALTSVSLVNSLVGWRAHGQPGVNSSTDFTNLFMIVAIPGIGLLAGGRGRKFIGTTVAGCALTVVALITAFLAAGRRVLDTAFYDPQIATMVGAVLAIVGLSLIFVSTSRLRQTRTMARGYLAGGAIVLVLWLISGVLMTNHGFWGEPACSYAIYQSPSAYSCRQWQKNVAEVQSIGALIGVTLLGAGFYSFGQARRAESTRRA